ncbi:hypothetical protein CBER1_10009 [Cercospora berteroae]|uniref:Uncharacterized protein n=1 Tax=Cercospora berteroae TaxID=357750 RepID=A0A2S6CIF2_9PEZI|nr:hypothetical protein CBER1_10009 [Cercospora berteroae]
MTDNHNKPCTLCGTSRSVLVRCQIDDSRKWQMVCPGECWKSVSGGQEDARGFEKEHPFYRYGGMWKVRNGTSLNRFFRADIIWLKNKHSDGPLSAKKPEKVKKRQREERAGREKEKITTDEPAELAESKEGP